MEIACDPRICYARILIPTDGSEPAWDAARQAVYLAKQCGSELHVLYVVEGVKAFKTGIHYQEAAREMSRDGERAVKRVQKLADKEGVNCTVLAVEGDAANTILEFAQEHHCDLIVMGSVGMNAIERVLVGSVTSKVVERAHCSVHVVRPRGR